MRKQIILIISAYLTALNVYSQVPTIISFSPDSGSVGTPITIRGTNLSNPTALIIGGTTAIVVSSKDSTLVAMVMPDAITGSISITTAGGTTMSSSNFTILSTSFPSVQQGAKLVGLVAAVPSFQGSAVAISADGNTAIVGGSDDDNRIGAAWVYTRTENTWSQQGHKLIGTGAIGVDADQGASVSLSADGNTAIIGGPNDNNGIGAAWIFTRNDSIWSQQGTKLIGSGYVGGFGGNSGQGATVSLSADGNTAMIGGTRDNNDTGAVWVFVRTDSTWSQQGSKLIGTDGIISVGEGGQGIVSLSADGNTAIVGGANDSMGVGAAWIFIRTDTTWSQQGPKLVGTGWVGGSHQGAVSISADGNTVMIGGSNDDYGKGAVWVFTRTNGIWSQQGPKLVGTGAVWPAAQGSVSLSADGNTALIGGPTDSIPGIWVFTRTGNTWYQQGDKLVGSGAVGQSYQGGAVSLSADGNTAIAGGFGDNNSTGAAWIFVASRLATGLTDIGEPNQLYLSCYPDPANNSFTIDMTGYSISEKKISIYDQLGRIVYQSTVSQNKLQINNKLSAGVYTIMVTQDVLRASVRLIME